MIPVSVIVPVKNEEANLASCLSQLGSFAEVIVVDSSSTDRTVEIAQAYGAKVINFEWNGRYPKKRNWTLLNHPPKLDWVLFLDADEILNDAFCVAIKERVSSDDDYAGYWLNYTNHFLGGSLKYGLPQRKLALFRTNAGLYEKIEENEWSRLDMEIHEHPVLDGSLGEIPERIDHDDDNGLAKFVERHREYALWEARRTCLLRVVREPSDRLTRRQRFKYRNMDKWWYAWLYFIYCYLVKRGFLDGAPGFYYAAFKVWYFILIRLLILENRMHEKQIQGQDSMVCGARSDVSSVGDCG